MSSSTKIKQAVAIFDIHYPVHHQPTLDAAVEYMQKNPPDIFVFGGDQFHFDCLSHHTKGTPMYRTRRSYMNDIEGFEKNILTPLEAVLPKKVEKVWHEGNHERFPWDFIEEHPELEGAVDHIGLLNLVERGWKVIPLGHASKLGKLTVAHGEILSGQGNQGSAFPAKKAVDVYSGNVLVGHSHSPQSWTKCSPVEQTDKWQGHVAPCACSVNPIYLRNRATSWLNGFCLIDILPNDNFNYYPIIVSAGQFSFGGKVYGKGKRK
jgi:hypothetical protein